MTSFNQFRKLLWKSYFLDRFNFKEWSSGKWAVSFLVDKCSSNKVFSWFLSQLAEHLTYHMALPLWSYKLMEVIGSSSDS